MEDRITSLQNSWVKRVVSLHEKKERDKEGLIILEGKKLIEGAREAGIEIIKIFSTHASNGITLVDDKVIKKMSTTTTPTDVIAIAKKPECELKNYKKMILLDSIQDAGNLGTIIRTACAFDIDAILLYGNCTDEFSPKVLRASVGCAFKIPVIRINENKINELAKKYNLISTVVNSKNKIQDIDFKSPFILMFGSEATGLSNKLKCIQNYDFTLPMKKSVESLNLAISAGICLWEISKR